MKRIAQSICMILLLGSFFACNNKGQTTGLKNVTGRPGELVVVVNDEIWDGNVDSVFSKVLEQPQYGLPQSEPIFNLTQVPVKAFADIFKTSRNLMLVYVGDDVDSSGVFFSFDKYAHPQALVSINAKDKESLLNLFNTSSDKIIGFLLKAERDRLIDSYTDIYEKSISSKTKELFEITINTPPGFVIAKTSEDFMWVRFEAPETAQGIFIYSTPYVSDSAFTLDYLKNQRNLFLKKHVPGPVEGSYMTTETEMPLFFNTLKKDGNYAAEIRGLWKVENDFMGGPFISLSILDLLKRRVVTIEGYVYAPSKDKRNLLRQVEAMVYSVNFDNQKDMDKLNKQFD